MRRWVSFSLLAGLILSIVLLVAALLWGLLAAQGDDAGAAGAKGVAIVAGSCWALNFVLLVVLLACGYLQQTGERAAAPAETLDP